MLIGEVSKHSGVSARMLRHYDSVGLVSSTGRFQSGYRQYSAEDVRRLFHVEAGTRSGRRAAVASGRVVTNRLSRRRPSPLVVTAPGTELRGVDSRLGRGSILLVGCGGFEITDGVESSQRREGHPADRCEQANAADDKPRPRPQQFPREPAGGCSDGDRTVGDPTDTCIDAAQALSWRSELAHGEGNAAGRRRAHAVEKPQGRQAPHRQSPRASWADDGQLARARQSRAVRKTSARPVLNRGSIHGTSDAPSSAPTAPTVSDSPRPAAPIASSLTA